VLAHGLLDTLCSRGSDALIDHECLLQVVQALAGVAFLEVAEADAFKGTRFNKGTPMSRPCARTCQPGRAMALTACTMAQNGRLAHHAHRRRFRRAAATRSWPGPPARRGQPTATLLPIPRQPVRPGQSHSPGLG